MQMHARVCIVRAGPQQKAEQEEAKQLAEAGAASDGGEADSRTLPAFLAFMHVPHAPLVSAECVFTKRSICDEDDD